MANNFNHQYRIIFSFFLTLAAFSCLAQGVKVSASPGAPDNSAILDVESTTQGFAPPRMTAEQRDLIADPVEGLMIYNLTSHCTETYRGDELGWYSPCINYPTVVTQAQSEVFGMHATVPGEVLSDGGSVVSSRGVCWGTVPMPTVFDNITTSGSGVGPFSAYLSGLSPSTVYYARAFATNSSSTAYGEQITFTTTSGIVPFTSSTSWTAPQGVSTVNVLVVGGGGGGGCDNGGGGGAGGVLYNSFYNVVPGNSYSIVVGSGGAGASTATIPGTNGQNSSFSSLIAFGGGGGGSLQSNTGQNGGSGGGGVRKPGVSGPGGTGVAGQGYNGGNSLVDYNGAGGGGALAAGADGTASGAGNGGMVSPISDTPLAAVEAVERVINRPETVEAAVAAQVR